MGGKPGSGVGGHTSLFISGGGCGRTYKFIICHGVVWAVTQVYYVRGWDILSPGGGGADTRVYYMSGGGDGQFAGRSAHRGLR